MTIERWPMCGLDAKFEQEDFRHANWQGMTAQLNRLNASFDPEAKTWHIPEVKVEEFYRAKREFIDNVIHKDQIAFL